VIQDVRLLGTDQSEGWVIPFEIRNQDFNGTAGTELSGLPDRFGKDCGAAIFLFIPVDGGDNGMSKAQRLDRFRDAPRFFMIDRQRSACLD
jgi:hypothetical protein